MPDSLQFEWDRDKAAASVAKHGVSFAEAITAFGDPLSLTIADPDHSEGESRYVLIGRTHRNRLVVVAHTERGERLWIISARQPTPREARRYEQQQSI